MNTSVDESDSPRLFRRDAVHASGNRRDELREELRRVRGEIAKLEAGSFPLLVQAEMHLRPFYDRKEALLNLPREVAQGDYDHAHVQALRSGKQKSPPRSPPGVAA